MPPSPVSKGAEKAALCPPSLPSSLTSNPPRGLRYPQEHHPTPAVHTGPVCGQPSQPWRPQPTGTFHGGLCRAGACGSREPHVLGLPVSFTSVNLVS